jgi:hypothetical protein
MDHAPSVKRVVITSSFAAVRDPFKGNWPEHTYSEAEWNPMTLEDGLSNPGSGYTGTSSLYSPIHHCHSNLGNWFELDGFIIGSCERCVAQFLTMI